MTSQKQLKRMSKELEELYNEIPEGTYLLDTVQRIVELELLLEAECNK